MSRSLVRETGLDSSVATRKLPPGSCDRRSWIMRLSPWFLRFGVGQGEAGFLPERSGPLAKQQATPGEHEVRASVVI